MSDAISKISGISKILEDRFFFSESLVLKEQLAQLKRKRESAEALSIVSGIVNESVLMEFVALGIRPEIMAAMCLVPIIEVAWADGVIDDKERQAVLDGARQHGFAEDHAILCEWLKHPPTPPLMDAWLKYMQSLGEILSKETFIALKADVISHANDVAKSSGSFLGLTNPISPAEQAVLDTMARV
jgi:hypothetical protein